MSNKSGRTVSKRDDGQWANMGNGNERASDLHPTQKAAVDAAKKALKESGGGELTVMGVDGKIRSKDTIAPGNDPNPPKDKEN